MFQEGKKDFATAPGITFRSTLSKRVMKMEDAFLIHPIVYYNNILLLYYLKK
jgi:hypothetical protein